MNFEELDKSGLIFFRTIVGSNAYGTNTPESDIDEKGFFWIPSEAYLGLNPPIQAEDSQISDDNNDKTFYSLYNAFELLKNANPNLIELLWMPEDCILKSEPAIMQDLLENRSLFITKQAYYSHAEYARNQIKKARGKNKKVHNPQPKERPRKEDFVRIILINDLAPWWECDQSDYDELEEKNKFPLRPTPLKDVDIDLSEYHIAALEHVPNTYRLYYYGKGARGVFRGNDMLVCESIPKADEWHKIVGLMIYDQNEYDKAVKEWGSYWEWVKNRNESRWIDQEKGLLTYDAKNMAHCMRLMMASENILTIGEPTVRFEGEKLEFLMKIRRGEFEYEELMEHVDLLDKKLEDLHKKSTLPERVDEVRMDKLYRHLMKNGEKLYGKI
ncbi:MAG: nucleotidyltransferase domain-containing protein [Synergistaceae bacterium]